MRCKGDERSGLNLLLLFTVLLLGPAAWGVPLASPTATTALPTPTRIVKPALGNTLMTNGSFEAPVLAAGTFKYNSALTAAEKAALVWTLTGGGAVSTNGSAFTSRNPNTAFGSQVAVLQSTASMTANYTFPYGGTPYRVRYWAAQRVVGTTLNKQRVRIKVNGVDVGVETPVQPAGAPLGAYAEYVSRPFEVTTANVTYAVAISTDNPAGGDNTVFIDNVRIEHLLRWTDPNAWYLGDGVTTAPSAPVATDDVSIPAGRTIVIQNTIPKAGTIVAEGELLVDNLNAALEARAIIVMGTGGRFEVGREELPFAQSFTLTLKGGNAATENIVGAGTNLLMAMGGGSVDLHGASRQSWTKLAASAAVGATSIQVAGTPIALGWAVGDQIVVAPTARINPAQSPDLPIAQCEVRTVTSVTTVGANTALGLNAALTYAHTGAVKTYANVPTGVPAAVDERAAVGLLTHNVKLQGDGTTTGGHVMIMKDMLNCTLCQLNGGGIARVSNVQFYKMGQKQRLARYPFHWHMLAADGAGQFIRDCSIVNSFNRVLSIHGTDFAEVEGNVAYDHIGHGILLEDGGEENNIITNNLIMGTRMAALQAAYVGGVSPPTDAEELLDFNKNEAVIPTDNSHNEVQNRSPAAFWITNPNNFMDGNIAAGTMGTGFWFALPAKPTGLSANNTYFNTREPYKNDLGSFEGNAAQSCMSGIDVNDSIATDTTLIRNSAWRPTNAAHLVDFSGFANSLALYSGLGADQRDKIFYDTPVLADNDTHIRLADYGTVQSSLIVANTGNGAQTAGAAHILYQPYDGAGRLKLSHIIGWDVAGTGITLFNSGGSATNHPNHLFQGLTYANSAGTIVTTRPRVIAADQSLSDLDGTGYPKAANQWGVVVRDVDGTTAKLGANHSMVSNHRMMRTASDVNYQNIDGAASYVYVSDKKFALLFFTYPNAVADQSNPPHVFPNNPDVTYTRTGGATGELQPTAFVDAFKNFNSTQMPVIVRGASAPYNTQVPVTYRCSFPFVPAGGNAVKLVLALRDIDPGDISPILKIVVTGMPVSTVTVGTLTAVPFATLTSDAPASSGYYRDTANSILYLRLVNPIGSTANSITVNLSW
jgi:hypothetical protein